MNFTKLYPYVNKWKPPDPDIFVKEDLANVHRVIGCYVCRTFTEFRYLTEDTSVAVCSEECYKKVKDAHLQPSVDEDSETSPLESEQCPIQPSRSK